MNYTLFRSLFVRSTTELSPAAGLRRSRGMIVLGVIAIVYLLLLALTRVSADAAEPVAQPSTRAVQQDTPAVLVDDDDTANENGDVLSPAFLGEYDRLSAAETSAETSARNTTVSTDAGPLSGTILVSLLVVAGLAYGGIWGYKQVTRQKGSTFSADGKHLVLQETQAIGAHQKLHLVRLGEELLLLGATDHNITCLARYDADQFAKSFDDHLQTAHHAYTPQSTSTASVPLQESLSELRKVQRWSRGDDNA